MEILSQKLGNLANTRSAAAAVATAQTQTGYLIAVGDAAQRRYAVSNTVNNHLVGRKIPNEVVGVRKQVVLKIAVRFGYVAVVVGAGRVFVQSYHFKGFKGIKGFKALNYFCRRIWNM
jgi:hypothetical protein